MTVKLYNDTRYCSVCWFRTVGTAVGRRTRRVVAVTELVTAVRSANIVTGRRITSPANRTSRRLARRRQPQHRATASPPITAGLREPPTPGAVAGLRRWAPSRPPPSPSRRRSTSARHRRRRSVVTARAQRHQRPSPRRRLVLMAQEHAQKQPPKLPPSYDCGATWRLKNKFCIIRFNYGIFVIRAIHSLHKSPLLRP